MLLLFTIVLFCLVMGSVSIYGYSRYVRPSRVLDRFKSDPSWEQPTAELPGDASGVALPVKLLQQVGEQIPVSPSTVSEQRRYLIAAGYRSDSALHILYGIKAVAAVFLFLFSFFVVLPHMPNLLVMRLALIVLSVVVGFFGPSMWLEKMVKTRQEKLRLSLPDALDLMVVCVEAGLGLDQAVMTVSRELQITHPEICEEFSLMNLEMRAGVRRAEALRNLARRTGEDEIRRLVAILVQTDRFGTSMGDALRTHSDFMRVRRRQQAEERAAKVGVKLVFPIFFFILPAMFIVSAGPGVLQVVKYLLPLMKSFGG